MGAGATLYQAAQLGFFHQGSAATPTRQHPPPDNEERAGRTVAASSSSWPLAVGGKPCFLVVVLSAAWTSTSAAASSSAEQLRFDMPKTNWPPDLLDFFITALVDECRAGNRPHRTLNPLGRKNVLKRLRDYTNRDWTWEPCKSKWRELKKKWTAWKYLHTFSGIDYHPRTVAIVMSEDWWEDKLKVHPVAKVFKQTRLEREEDLNIIFANMEPVNVGPCEDGGHERG
ncbi:hypothetical protein U9M48_024922 [Paspalum notatum var. saurae]|uniref:Myb/SANT-like domain-containing protein n=1 Tax=Paspalum notatum var. saurae TaxID=547442 RepID=A0AAQ3TRN3_PASNO